MCVEPSIQFLPAHSKSASLALYGEKNTFSIKLWDICFPQCTQCVGVTVTVTCPQECLVVEVQKLVAYNDFSGYCWGMQHYQNHLSKQQTYNSRLSHTSRQLVIPTKRSEWEIATEPVRGCGLSFLKRRTWIFPLVTSFAVSLSCVTVWLSGCSSVCCVAQRMSGHTKCVRLLPLPTYSFTVCVCVCVCVCVLQYTG